MAHKNDLYTMRDSNYTKGLLDMIHYINDIMPTKEMKMIEIGSYAGESTEIFAQHFKSVIAIDPYINSYDPNDITCQYMDLTDVYGVFMSRMTKHSNVILHREMSDEAHNHLSDNEFHFVYIDGMHTYEQVKKDISNYYPKIVVGGFIGGHDYHPVWGGVVQAINESFVIDKTFSDTSWIKLKK